MKTITKLTFIATAIAALASSAALADNPALRQQLDQQRLQAGRDKEKTTTIAAYAHGQGTGQRATDQRTKTRFEWRTNAHGQVFGVYGTAK